MLKKIISYPLSVLHYIVYAFLFLFFHLLQWIAIHWIRSRKAHQAVVETLNFFLVHSLMITGNKVRFTSATEIPEGVPILFVANHQSIYDVPPLIWFLRKYSRYGLRFVGKKELGNGTPSITINLRYNGSALIDRSRPQDAVPQLEEFGRSLQANNDGGMIFPEGTRSRDGAPKPFKIRGIEAIMKNMPDGYVVPITINNSWKTLRYGAFPLGIGNAVSFHAHAPIKIDTDAIRRQIREIEKTITNDVVIDNS
ncbi:MAG: lysophospholipid acyltransferase family protein [Capnocytophaga sp.]|nr:lysophospholipid acyltransferase family protein [Capnocytophaga sp.]